MDSFNYGNSTNHALVNIINNNNDSSYVNIETNLVEHVLRPNTVYAKNDGTSGYYITNHTNLEGVCIREQPFIYLSQGERWYFLSNPSNCTPNFGDGENVVHLLSCRHHHQSTDKVTSLVVFNKTNAATLLFERHGYTYVCGRRLVKTGSIVTVNTKSYTLKYPIQSVRCIILFTKWERDDNTGRFYALADNRVLRTNFIVTRTVLKFCTNKFGDVLMVPYFLRDDNFIYNRRHWLTCTDISPFVYYGIIDQGYLRCEFELSGG